MVKIDKFVFVKSMIVACLAMLCINYLMINNLTTIISCQNEDMDTLFDSFILIQKDALKAKCEVNQKLDGLKKDMDHTHMMLLINFLTIEKQSVTHNISFIQLDGQDSLNVIATAYTNSADETDDTPNITATGKTVSPKYIACSKDIIKQWGYGTKVILAAKTSNGGLVSFGEYEIQDTMNERYTNACDVFMWDKEDALLFGRREMRLIKI